MLTCMQLNLLLDQCNAQGKGEQYRYDRRRENALAGVKRQLRFHVDNCAQQSDKQAKLQQELKRQLQSDPAQDFDVWWSDTLQKLRGDHPALWPAGVQPDLSTLQAELCCGQRRGAFLQSCDCIIWLTALSLLSGCNMAGTHLQLIILLACTSAYRDAHTGSLHALTCQGWRARVRPSSVTDTCG